jgi:hypothetical protein
VRCAVLIAAIVGSSAGGLSGDVFALSPFTLVGLSTCVSAT